MDNFFNFNQVEFFNISYIMFLVLGFGSIVGLHFLFRKKSEKSRKILVYSLIIFNFVLHFAKLLFYPYNQSLERGLRDLFAVNICAVSVIVFPFILFGKNKDLKDFMFYLGMLSGGLALLIPTEALGEQIWVFDTLRFYVAHWIIIAGPVLMVTLKLHKINYRKIWKMPIYMVGYLMFIMVNQIVQSELGIIALRNGEFSNPNYPNPSMFWKAKSGEALFAPFNIFTPDFLKTVPYLDRTIANGTAGQMKYWPLVWMIPSVIVYFTVLPLLISIPFERKAMKQDFKNIYQKTKNIFRKNKTPQNN